MVSLTLGWMDDSPYWTPEVLAERLSVSLVTARRWKRTGRIPKWAIKMIRIVFGGEIGLIDPAWRLWRVKGGALIGPDGWTSTPGEVLSIPLLYARAQAYQTKLKVSIQADWIEAKYVAPGDTQAGEHAERFRTAPADDHWRLTEKRRRRV